MSASRHGFRVILQRPFLVSHVNEDALHMGAGAIAGQLWDVDRNFGSCPPTLLGPCLAVLAFRRELLPMKTRIKTQVRHHACVVRAESRATCL